LAPGQCPGALAALESTLGTVSPALFDRADCGRYHIPWPAWSVPSVQHRL